MSTLRASHMGWGLFTWRVNDVDRVVLLVAGRRNLGDPVAEGRSALNCDALLAFEVHTVHLGPDVVATTDLMNVLDSAGIIENPLRQCGLTRVYVSGDADIALEVETGFVLVCELVNWGRGVGRCFRSDP